MFFLRCGALSSAAQRFDEPQLVNSDHVDALYQDR
jgi:hypothetical protein